MSSKKLEINKRASGIPVGSSTTRGAIMKGGNSILENHLSVLNKKQQSLYSYFLYNFNILFIKLFDFTYHRIPIKIFLWDFLKISFSDFLD